MLLHYGIPLGVLFSAMVLFRIGPYLSWHLLHGFHIEVSGIRFFVPSTYRVLAGSTAKGTVLAGVDGTIMIESNDSTVAKQEQGALPTQEQITIRLDERFTQEGERSFTLAGRKGQCTEYIGTLVGDSEYKTDNVECSFERDMRVEYKGAMGSKKKFYGFLKSAQPVGGKR